jgi:hypothetical protein
MKFLAELTNYMRRLEAAGAPVRDGKAQRVLLNGLDQDIFEVFIQDAKRNPYTNYVSLEKALQRAASEPRLLKKLAALKPGLSQSTLSTRAQTPQLSLPVEQVRTTQRLDKIEALLVSMADQNKQTGPAKGKPPCHRFSKTGQCAFGDKCRFSHHKKQIDNRNRGDQPPPGQWCDLHQTAWHNNDNCKTQQKIKSQNPTSTQQGTQQINTSTHTEPNVNETHNGYAFMFPTRFDMPQHVFSLANTPKIDMWCVDGASTTFATYDRARCVNLRSCNVTIKGPNMEDTFVCTEIGDCDIDILDEISGEKKNCWQRTCLSVKNFLFISSQRSWPSKRGVLAPRSWACGSFLILTKFLYLVPRSVF